MDPAVIAQYEHQAEKLNQAIADLGPEQIKAKPVPGKWSTLQVIMHLVDAELAFADRIKRCVAHDKPLVLAWDENRYAARTFYEQQSAADGVQWIDLTRRLTATILKNLSPADFDRTLVHSEAGLLKLSDVVGRAVWHFEHHFKFINDKRIAMGKPAVL